MENSVYYVIVSPNIENLEDLILDCTQGLKILDVIQTENLVQGMTRLTKFSVIKVTIATDLIN